MLLPLLVRHAPHIGTSESVRFRAVIAAMDYHPDGESVRLARLQERSNVPLSLRTLEPKPFHDAENYTAVSLRGGTLTRARLDKGRRCRRLPAGRQAVHLRLHQKARSDRTPAKAPWNHLR